jgi:hypothetical protein
VLLKAKEFEPQRKGRAQRKAKARVALPKTKNSNNAA